jgi:hypothetical protein
VVFGTLYIFSLMGLIVALISDLTYTWVDPRIDFESREDLMAHGRHASPAASRPPRSRRPGRTRRAAFSSRRSISAGWQFQEEPARLLVAVDLSGVLFFLALFAEFIANDRPDRRSTRASICAGLGRLSGEKFGGDFEPSPDYRDPFIQERSRPMAGCSGR